MTAEATAPTRVFIYGSCVSRDSLEHAGPERYTVTRYVARQSLVSAYGGSARVEPGGTITSPFQRRMVEGDAEGNLLAVLRAHVESTDLLLWDLTDERLGVLVAPDGAILTRSVDLISADIAPRLDGWRHVPFGSDEHFTVWAAALDQFCADLRLLGLLNRTVLLAVPWAASTDDGGPVPRSFGVSSGEANALLERYYRAAETHGVRVERVPEDLAVAGADHRWGRAPFHYAHRTYDAIVAIMEDVVGDLPMH